MVVELNTNISDLHNAIADNNDLILHNEKKKSRLEELRY